MQRTLHVVTHSLTVVIVPYTPLTRELTSRRRVLEKEDENKSRREMNEKRRRETRWEREEQSERVCDLWLKFSDLCLGRRYTFLGGRGELDLP